MSEDDKYSDDGLEEDEDVLPKLLTLLRPLEKELGLGAAVSSEEQQQLPRDASARLQVVAQRVEALLEYRDSAILVMHTLVERDSVIVRLEREGVHFNMSNDETDPNLSHLRRLSESLVRLVERWSQAWSYWAKAQGIAAQPGKAQKFLWRGADVLEQASEAGVGGFGRSGHSDYGLPATLGGRATVQDLARNIVQSVPP